MANIGKGISRYIAYFNAPDGSLLFRQLSFKRSDETAEYQFFVNHTLPKLIDQAALSTNGRFYVRVSRMDDMKNVVAYYSGAKGWLTPAEYDALKALREALLQTVTTTYKFLIPAVSRGHDAISGYTAASPTENDALRNAYEQATKAYVQNRYLMNEFLVYKTGKTRAEQTLVGRYSMDTFKFQFPYLFQTQTI